MGTIRSCGGGLLVNDVAKLIVNWSDAYQNKGPGQTSKLVNYELRCGYEQILINMLFIWFTYVTLWNLISQSDIESTVELQFENTNNLFNMATSAVICWNEDNLANPAMRNCISLTFLCIKWKQKICNQSPRKCE